MRLLKKVRRYGLSRIIFSLLMVLLFLVILAALAIASLLIPPWISKKFREDAEQDQPLLIASKDEKGAWRCKV